MVYSESMRRLAALFLALIIVALSFYSLRQYRNQQSGTAGVPVMPRNVYLITASGLRAGHLSSYLYKPIQTPAMDFLAYDGIRFTNAITPSTESLTSHLSLFTGLYPFHEPAKQTMEYLLDLGKKNLPKNLVTLPQILEAKGYRTTAVVADPELRSPVFLSKLFNEVYAGDRFLHPWETGYSPGIACKIAREWVRSNQTRRHFLFLNFHEPTQPFNPPDPYKSQYRQYPYDGEVAGLDEQIGLFINSLKDLGLFQRSIIILTAPYGESLAEASRFSSPDGPTLHVPLMIVAPNLLPRHQNYEAQVSLVDLLPTVLTLLEEPRQNRMDGVSLLIKGENRQIDREFVFGMIPYGRMIGTTAEYFVRNNVFLYRSGRKEDASPNSTAHKATEAETAEWTQEGRRLLKQEGIRMPPGIQNLTTANAVLDLEKAIQLARQKQPDAAIDVLNALPAPAASGMMPLLGSLYAARGDPENALNYLRQAANISATSTLPFFARAALDAGRPAEAFEAMKKYQKSIGILPYYLRSTYSIALYGLGRYEEALLELDAVVKENPRYAEAYLYRGRAWNKLGNLPEAEADWKRAVEADHDYAAAYLELASLFGQKDPRTDAVPYLRQLILLEPDNYNAMLQLAEIHQESGNHSEASRLSSQIILNCEDPEIKRKATELIAQ